MKFWLIDLIHILAALLLIFIGATIFLIVFSLLFDVLTGIDLIRNYIQPYFQCLLLDRC